LSNQNSFVNENIAFILPAIPLGLFFPFLLYFICFQSFDSLETKECNSTGPIWNQKLSKPFKNFERLSEGPSNLFSPNRKALIPNFAMTDLPHAETGLESQCIIPGMQPEAMLGRTAAKPFILSSQDERLCAALAEAAAGVALAGQPEAQLPDMGGRMHSFTEMHACTHAFAHTHSFFFPIFRESLALAGG